jgi:hypothetical protein
MLVGRDSSVGIKTRYGMNVPGIESKRERDFPHPSPVARNEYRIPFERVKRPKRGADHPPSSSAEVKERVELYLYSPLELHGQCEGEI